MSAVTLSPSQTIRPQRVLACVLCQQRKVKCDRKYPCANCIKSQTQCIPATQASRRRRRRFPERELLERLRNYEDLLRQNNIKFEPLHKEAVAGKESPNIEGRGCDSDNDQSKSAGSPSMTVKSERVYEAKNVWHAMSQEFRDPDNDSDSSDDDIREATVKNAMYQYFENNDRLLFGSCKTAVDISTLHPEPVQIFRLWQLYLENVNPLLKVTHTPSLQGRIIEAAGNVFNIMPTLEALMFSIYCMSITSLAVEDCKAIFGSSKTDLLTRYQFGCQQALLNCGFLRSNDRDCLTALYLYLISLKPNTIPQSLSSMLGIAIRIAQRMGIHMESVLAKSTALEAEMGRRLWWSLVLFDTRIGEMSAGSNITTLIPTWDCRIPLNVNDSDFRPEMKEAPQVQGRSTDALFAVVRSEMGDFVRHTMFHLDFTSPALKPLAKDVHHGSVTEASELVSLENLIEDKHLKYCDPENPLHFMTIWTARAYLAKCRLMEHHSKHSNPSMHLAETQRDAAMSYALTMLECDTKIMTSPLTKGFLWLAQFHFPFPAYIQIVQHMKRRPFHDKAEQAWEVMSDNYKARFGYLPLEEDNPFFRIFTKLALQAWEAREIQQSKRSGESFVTPRIVLSIRHKLSQLAQYEKQNCERGQLGSAVEMRGMSDFLTPMPIGFGGSNSLFYSMGGQQDGCTVAAGPGRVYPDMLELVDPLDVDINQLDWSAMDWDLVNLPAGDGENTGPSSLPY